MSQSVVDCMRIRGRENEKNRGSVCIVVTSGIDTDTILSNTSFGQGHELNHKGVRNDISIIRFQRCRARNNNRVHVTDSEVDL